jgi:hypothetical protein
MKNKNTKKLNAIDTAMDSIIKRYAELFSLDIEYLRENLILTQIRRDTEDLPNGYDLLIDLYSYVIVKNEQESTVERSKLTPTLRMEILKHDNFRCCLCGKSPKDGVTELHVDHIIPISKGGTSTENNLQTLCCDCNIGKRCTIINLPSTSDYPWYEWFYEKYIDIIDNPKCKPEHKKKMFEFADKLNIDIVTAFGILFITGIEVVTKDLEASKQLEG